MNLSVEKLRVWLLVGAGLLVAVIAAFLGYAHYRAHRFLTGIPGRLGMDIQQETNGFTYSQSNGPKGKTIYTIHAAKALKRKNGKVTLEDVGIVLYGHGDGSSDRVDRIYGKEFEYDQSAGVIRAMGEVHIDLQAPAPPPGDAKARTEYAKGQEVNAASHKDERLIHVKTSGLVFLQKLGVAATDQDLEFEFNGMTGHAHGAEYSSDSGLLVLQSAVKVSGLKNGEPTVLTATRAELDRQAQKVILSRAVYTVVGSSGTRISKGERVTAYLRHEGSVEQAFAEGGISLTDAGATVTAERGELHWTAANQPQTGVLSGAVKYVAEEPLRKAQGEANEARATFDKAGQLQHVVMTGAVHLRERTRAVVTASSASAQTGWSDRELNAKGLELAVVTGADKKLELQEAKATGDARLTMVNPPAAGAKTGHKGATTSALSGDVLTARFTKREGGTHVKDVHGAGHTMLRRVSDAGAVETSSGDGLDADFQDRKNVPSGEPTNDALIQQGTEEIVTAVQHGHVVMTNKPAPRTADGSSTANADVGASTSEQRATAERASYDGSTEKVTLTGTVQVSDVGSVVWADRVVMDQQTGDAVADGAVKATYQQQAATQGKQQGGGAADAVHVLAVRGELKHDAGVALFYGTAGKPARLWQGTSQVEAPVLRFEQKEKRLVARGDGPGMVVHAVFVNAASLETLGGANATGGPQTPKSIPGVPASKRAVPVRVASHEMTYNDGARRADFAGGVLVEDADGTMRAQLAVIYLKAAAGPSAKSPLKISADSKNGARGEDGTQSAFLGGSVERVVVTGRVDLVQPGRHALGDQLVYTASDGLFVLTGLPGIPPRMMDETRGAITGATMSFHAGDNSVVVSNGPDGAAGQRVRTETRVKQ